MRLLRSSLPMPDDVNRHFMIIMTAVMSLLAVLALAGTLMIKNVVDRWHADIVGALTIQVVPEAADAADTRSTGGGTTSSAGGDITPVAVEELDRIVALVRDEPGVASVEIMSNDALRHLMEPWLGSTDIVVDLPMPRLIAVTLDDGARVNPYDLEARLQAITPGVLVEDHQSWLSRLVSLAHGLMTLAWMALGLVTLVTCLTVIQATRSALTVHWEMIEVLHLMGARDEAVATHFAGQAASRALIGALIGTVVAIGAVLLLRSLATGLEGGFIPQLSLTLLDWLVILSLPVLAAGLAGLTTGWTVMRTLARML